MNKYQNQGGGSSDKTIYWLIGGFSLLALLGIGLVALGESKSQGQVASYTTNDTTRPKTVVKTKFFDLGNMKVTDEKTVEFAIENSGDKPLQLFKGSSSCGCTFGQIVINGDKSPEFSMHSKSTWTGSVNPGEKATLLVTYKPSIMPVKGEVSRAVYVSTNDPDNKELTFTVKAFVE